MPHYISLVALALALGLQAPTVEPGWTSLFNGKDFTGWRISVPGTFTIEDGAIKANGPASHAFYDGPFRNHMFRNFELKVDVMTRTNSNGGIYVLTEFQAAGFPRNGFEIQVNNSYNADKRRTGSLYGISDVTDVLIKDDVWFTEHITVTGNMIMVSVNDKMVVHWMPPAGATGAAAQPMNPGTIALQGHDPKSVVYYKNIRIKPLD